MKKTLVKTYKDAEEYQRGVVLQTALGWEIVDVNGVDRGRSGMAKGATLGAAVLTGGILAPAAIFAMSKKKQLFTVTYSSDDSVEPDLPVIPEGLGYWKTQQWLVTNRPEGIGLGREHTEWSKAVQAHTKAVRNVG
jgi:hypothetical protein